MWWMPKLMYGIGAGYLLGCIIIDVISYLKLKSSPFEIDEKVIGSKNYFQRLCNVDRKRWLAEEIYMRNNYNY